MTSTSRLRPLAVLVLIAGLALTGSFSAPVDASDSYDCTNLPDCSQNLCFTRPQPYGVFLIGPCDDGNGDFAYQSCGREGIYPCRLTS